METKTVKNDVVIQDKSDDDEMVMRVYSGGRGRLRLELGTADCVIGSKIVRKKDLDSEKSFFQKLADFGFFAEEHLDDGLELWKKGLLPRNSDSSTARVMDYTNPRWDEFIYRLNLHVNVREDEEDEHGFKFTCDNTLSQAQKIVEQDMGEIFDAEFFEVRGGYCTCEILWNVRG